MSLYWSGAQASCPLSWRLYLSPGMAGGCRAGRRVVVDRVAGGRLGTDGLLAGLSGFRSGRVAPSGSDSPEPLADRTGLSRTQGGIGPGSL